MIVWQAEVPTDGEVAAVPLHHGVVRPTDQIGVARVRDIAEKEIQSVVMLGIGAQVDARHIPKPSFIEQRPKHPIRRQLGLRLRA
jgi:hypothetical protein